MHLRRLDMDGIFVRKVHICAKGFQCRNRQVNVRSAFKWRDNTNQRIFTQIKQCKNQAGNKLAADVSSQFISAAFKFTANSYRIIGFAELKSLFQAQIFIDTKRSFQKSLAATQGNTFT